MSITSAVPASASSDASNAPPESPAPVDRNAPWPHCRGCGAKIAYARSNSIEYTWPEFVAIDPMTEHVHSDCIKSRSAEARAWRALRLHTKELPKPERREMYQHVGRRLENLRQLAWQRHEVVTAQREQMTAEYTQGRAAADAASIPRADAWNAGTPSSARRSIDIAALRDDFKAYREAAREYPVSRAEARRLQAARAAFATGDDTSGGA